MVQVIAGDERVEIIVIDCAHPALGIAVERQLGGLRAVVSLTKQVIDHAYDTGGPDREHFRRVRPPVRLIDYADSILVSCDELEIRTDPDMVAVLA